ncbi:GDSL-type esterase/lipase family protein [Acinetobacter sp.]|nr:GDSL-type esterase/lipase family protein [Acinetobacter sp.]MBC70416.1 hypothetical protein [Acinetobacter sp.]MBT51704.1 hypothetical protein [Acinetobacter sp.]
MADIVTKEDLENASIDAKDLGECVNGNETGIITPRLGDPYPTLPAAIASVENKGGYITIPNLTALNAIVPEFNHQVARNDETGDEYRWDPNAIPSAKWVPTGKNYLNDAKAYADENGMFKPKTYASAVDFNTLTTYGTHTLLNGTVWNDSTNRPEQTAQWGHVLVFPTTANVITQVAIMGNVTKTFAMRLRTDTGVWQSWGYFHSFDKVLELLKADIVNVMSAQRTSSTINQLNPVKVLTNYEVRSDGTLSNTANAVSSDLIYCFNKDSIYVSGLQANNAATRYYRFLNQNGLLISGGGIASGSNEGYIPVPSGAYSFQITLKSSNNLNALDASIAQVEFGTTKTPYIGYDYGAISHINGIALADTQFSLNSAAAGKNLFDKSTALNGYEVYSDGRVLVQASSITSAPIIVSGLSNITISGLVQNPELVRYGAFKDSSGVVLSVVQIPKTATSATFTIPANAVTFQFSIKQRSASTPDLNVIQVESGTNVTSYTAFIRGISAINGLQIVSRNSGGSSGGLISRAFGAIGYFAGDSRVQTSNVDVGDYSSASYVSNYPKFIKDTLKLSGFMNLAKSGASFAETTSAQLPFQKMRHQVQTAIDIGGNPTFFMLDAGTNDMNWYRSNQALQVPIDTLGSYETAMSKDIADLDFSKTAEAMRWCLFKIREAFPNAVCFYATQTQRADTDPVYQEISNNVMVKLAKRYGFTVIDGLYGFEIIKDFEVWEASGRYLSDGLHPNLTGQQVMCNFYSSQIIQRMTY